MGWSRVLILMSASSPRFQAVEPALLRAQSSSQLSAGSSRHDLHGRAAGRDSRATRQSHGIVRLGTRLLEARFDERF